MGQPILVCKLYAPVGVYVLSTETEALIALVCIERLGENLERWFRSPQAGGRILCGNWSPMTWRRASSPTSGREAEGDRIDIYIGL